MNSEAGRYPASIPPESDISEEIVERVFARGAASREAERRQVAEWRARAAGQWHKEEEDDAEV